MHQYRGDYKLVAVNLAKYRKYDGRDAQFMEGYINMKLVLESWRGLLTGSI